MKKITFKVELTFSEECPNEIPSKETFENMITGSIRYETSKEEIIEIKSEVISFEGVTFKE